MKRPTALILALLAGTALTGCTTSGPESLAFVEYYNATSAPYTAYVEADKKLSATQKARRLEAVAAAGEVVAGIEADRSKP